MIRISPIPALENNYFWLIQPDQHSRDAFIVDPGDATPVMDALSLEGLNLKAILVTHHHRDHISGIAELKEKFDVPVYGRQSDRIPQITHPLLPGDSLQLDTLHHKTMTFQVLDVTGHTLDHIAYFLPVMPFNHPAFSAVMPYLPVAVGVGLKGLKKSCGNPWSVWQIYPMKHLFIALMNTPSTTCVSP
jgi:hypothetical protein